MVKKKYVVLLLLSVGIVAIDQWSKRLVLERFRLGESLTLIEGFFNFTYVRNTGAAFGLLASADPAFRVPFFIVVPIAALAAIAWIFRKVPDGDWKLSTALSLVIGGAVGNLIDRLEHGFVVDFFELHWRGLYRYPAFNVADMAICIGVGVLMLDLITQKDSQEDAPAAR